MKSTYEGSAPYIFVSYAHRDSASIAPLIGIISDCYARVWYDDAIQPGTEWPEYIAKKLRGASMMIAFVSENYFDSLNCRRELAFAERLDKKVLFVFTDGYMLPRDVKKSKLAYREIRRAGYGDEEKFLEALNAEATRFGCSYGIYDRPSYDGTDDSIDLRRRKIAIIKKRERKSNEKIERKLKRTGFKRQIRAKTSGLVNILTTGAVLILNIAYPFLISTAYDYASKNYTSAILFILITAIPTLAVNLLSSLLFLLKGRKYVDFNDKSENISPIGWLAIICFAIGAIASPFFVGTTDSVFLKIVISAAINGISGFISIGIAGSISERA